MTKYASTARPASVAPQHDVILHDLEADIFATNEHHKPHSCTVQLPMLCNITVPAVAVLRGCLGLAGQLRDIQQMHSSGSDITP